ncbi:hypothetical protein OH492_27045 [Vibrio chagasii]|nr:hypothetical protein [Vibrio chagasii]
MNTHYNNAEKWRDPVTENRSKTYHDQPLAKRCIYWKALDKKGPRRI